MVLGVIPARYGSTRFPGKPLARVNGKPLIQLVWERAKGSKKLDRLLVATDDERIAKVVKDFGGEAMMTPSDLPSGTDRVWRAAKETPAQIVINIQGDEPFLQAQMVDRLVDGLCEDPQAEMDTLAFRMEGEEGYSNPNVVKVVMDSQGWALYFSRSPIPFHRSPPKEWYKHIGLYGYRRKTLERFVQWPASLLERAESLEQLRALEHGVRMKVLSSPVDTVGVDTEEDLKRVEALLKNA